MRPDAGALGLVAQTSKSAVSQVSKPAPPKVRLPADLEVGDTAGLETCATCFVGTFIGLMPVFLRLSSPTMRKFNWRQLAQFA